MTKTIFNLSDFVDGETASMVSLTQPSIEFKDMVDDLKPFWKKLHKVDDSLIDLGLLLIKVKSKYGEYSPEVKTETNEPITWDEYFGEGVDTESLFEMKVYNLYQHRNNRLSRMYFLDRIEVENNQSFENDEWARYTHTFQTKLDSLNDDLTQDDLPDTGLTHNMFPIEKLRAKSIYSSQVILPGLNPREIYDMMNKHGVYSAFASRLPLPTFGENVSENSGKYNKFAFLGGKTYFLTTYNSLTNLVRSTSFKTIEGEVPYAQLLDITESDYNRIDDIATQTNFQQALNPNNGNIKFIDAYKNWFEQHYRKILINPDVEVQFNNVSHLNYVGKYAYEFSPSSNGVHLISLLPSANVDDDIPNCGNIIDGSLTKDFIDEETNVKKIDGAKGGIIDLTSLARFTNPHISFISDLGVYDNHYEPNTIHWLYIKIPYTPVSDHVFLKFTLQFNKRFETESNFFGKDGYLGVVLRMDENLRDDVRFFTYGESSLKRGDNDYIQSNFDEDSTCSFYQYLRKGRIIQDEKLSKTELDTTFRIAHALDNRKPVEFKIKIPMDIENETGHTFKIGFISNIDTSAYQDSNGYLKTIYDVVKKTIRYCRFSISDIQIINPGMEENKEQELTWANYISAGGNSDEIKDRAEQFYNLSRIVNDLPYQKVVECNMSLRSSYNKKLFCPFTSADIFADMLTTKSFNDAKYQMNVYENLEDYEFKFENHRKYTNIISCGNKLSLIYQDLHSVSFFSGPDKINSVPTYLMNGEEKDSEKFTEGIAYSEINKVPVRFQKVETIDRINRFDNSIKHKANIFSVHVKNSGVSDYEKEIKYKVDNKLITQDEYEHKKTLIDSVRKQISLNIKQMAEKLAPATNQLVKIFID